MNGTLCRCLDDLEERIAHAVEEELLAEWRGFASGGVEGAVFSPRRPGPRPPRVEWPRVSVNDTLDNPELMALQQYSTCSDMLSEGNGSVLCVRANYGTGILPSLFGAEFYIMPRELETLPTVRPLPGMADIRDAVERGVPDLDAGLGERVFAMGRFFRDVAQRYPRIARHVHVYHPDAQGPMDVCELLWGSSLFYALVEEPELVKSLLELVTDTYIAFLERWFRLFPPSSPDSVHWGMVHKGRVMVRDDSAMNLSPGMFTEFIQPYDQRILKAFDGGATHFCGRGDHYIAEMCAMEGLYAVNMSQPELNDLNRVAEHTVRRGIPLIGLSREAAGRVVADGAEFSGTLHCW